MARGTEADGTSRKKVIRRSDEWPLDRSSVIEPEWAGRVVVILGGGPSLTPDVFERVGRERAADRCRVIAINNSYLLAPWADVLYFADWRWWQEHRGRKEFQEHAGLKVTLDKNQIEDEAFHVLRNEGVDGLPKTRQGVTLGLNSGYQALMLALRTGARKIALCGYDMHYPNGKDHWHAGHPWGATGEPMFTGGYTKFFNDLPPLGVEVVNASPGSVLKRFPFATLDEVFA